MTQRMTLGHKPKNLDLVIHILPGYPVLNYPMESALALQKTNKEQKKEKTHFPFLSLFNRHRLTPPQLHSSPQSCLLPTFPALPPPTTIDFTPRNTSLIQLPLSPPQSSSAPLPKPQTPLGYAAGSSFAPQKINPLSLTKSLKRLSFVYFCPPQSSVCTMPSAAATAETRSYCLAYKDSTSVKKKKKNSNKKTIRNNAKCTEKVATFSVHYQSRSSAVPFDFLSDISNKEQWSCFTAASFCLPPIEPALHQSSPFSHVKFPIPPPSTHKKVLHVAEYHELHNYREMGRRRGEQRSTSERRCLRDTPKAGLLEVRKNRQLLGYQMKTTDRGGCKTLCNTKERRARVCMFKKDDSESRQCRTQPDYHHHLKKTKLRRTHPFLNFPSPPPRYGWCEWGLWVCDSEHACKPWAPGPDNTIKRLMAGRPMVRRPLGKELDVTHTTASDRPKKKPTESREPNA
ncbi:hypothetical protein VP01_1498g1 [Puccinia sorghi]|uniref:Uncharacterized protein n=1 Tax=Puccinia sorghi TaxID=27349 RepID=A0A0L6VKZ0_9BASI|nr:hypothetical protein VP01_1498g1 [Puccinia sorghi]